MALFELVGFDMKVECLKLILAAAVRNHQGIPQGFCGGIFGAVLVKWFSNIFDLPPIAARIIRKVLGLRVVDYHSVAIGWLIGLRVLILSSRHRLPWWLGIRLMIYVLNRHIVGLAGPPGAGKTTIALEIVKRVNKLWPQKSCSLDSQVEPPEIAVVLPMDGFHLYRHQLDTMEDPKEAHARRGAPWTFNPDLFLKCLKTLREQGSVCAPSFDHGVGDPVEDDIFVNVQHKVVIVEGNYLLLEEGTWKEVSSMFDEKWFVDVDIDIAMERVLKRHIGTGNTPELAKQRIKRVKQIKSTA
nr:putative uridine kinase C227.14 isoform X1 [Tanacetum cinerariifolium]